MFALVATIAAGCGATNACVPTLPADCTPLYDPTFANVYAMTLHPTCAQTGSSCHSTEGMMGGVSYDDPDVAYMLLLAPGGGASPRVLPGNPACSILIERIEATDPARVMPLGAPLSAPVQCAIQTWIANGAMR